jgi:epoxyqueuosine reductase
VARVARYVWADDQERLLAGLGAVAERLRSTGHRAVVLSDQNHMVDRAVAHRAGLGWFGKNANMLIPGAGSWFILGSVLTDAEIDDPLDVVADGCGTCERCIDACPTGAIVAPGVVDARRCLSWTLQTTGPFPVEQRVALGDRIYGCDDCQEVCPPNRREVLRTRPGRPAELERIGDPDRAWVPVLEVLEATDAELLERHGRWYVAERNPRHLRRNALVVLGNIGDGADPRVRRALIRCLADPDPLVRSHAVWSARRLGCDDLLVDLATDPEPEVQEELARPVPPLVPAAGAARLS